MGFDWFGFELLVCLLMLVNFVAVVYTVCWFGCLCCFGSLMTSVSCALVYFAIRLFMVVLDWLS